MRYFVCWFGRVDLDPLDCGVDYFFAKVNALEFYYRMISQGFTAELWEGKQIQ